MNLIYVATDMPKINLLISLMFHFLSILECTVFCAKKSDHVVLLKGYPGFREGFNVFGDR